MARDVHELIDDLRRRFVTVFLTTHRLGEAERLCDRVAILNTTLRSIGRPDELRDRLFAARRSRSRPWLRSTNPKVCSAISPGWSRGAPAATPVTSSRSPTASLAAPAVTRALVAAGADVLSITESQHSLEDVYLELVGHDAGEGES